MVAVTWEFDGLPLHPLIVHAPVVLIPLVAGGLALFVFRQETRRVLGPILVLLALSAAFTAILAVASGGQLVDDLGRGDTADDHAARGELTRLLAIGVAVGTTGLVGIDRYRPDLAAARSQVPGLLVSATALVSVVVVGLTGHSGAQLAWEGKLRSTPTAASGGAAVAPVDEPAPSPAPTEGSEVDPTATTPAAPTPAEPFVDVTMGEWALITSVDEIPPGPTMFRVHNAGTRVHAFRIRTPGSGGDRSEWRSDAVAPGETIIFTADLPEGVLELTCPIEDDAGEHDELGMESRLSVRAGAPPPVAPAPPTPPPPTPTAAEVDAAPQPAPATSVAVDISAFAFNSADVVVPVGTDVTWTNNDPAPHTATGDTFDTGTLETGDSGSVTFTAPGDYAYFCSIHPSMTARVVVTG